MRKVILFSIALFASSFASFVTYAVTLEEALTSAYQNHEDLKIIRSDFLNEIEQFPRALAGFMPRVTAGFDATDTKTTRKGIPSAGIDNITTNSTRYSKNIALEQPIFNGGSSMAELKAAQSSYRASKGNYYAKEQNIIFDEINTYLNCAEAFEKYNISKISVKSNKKQLEAVKEKFRLGESTETEVASAETGLATAEANQALAYANVEASKANFSRIFAINSDGVKIPSVSTNMPVSFDEFVEKSVKNNPAIYAADHSTKASKAGELIAKGALLPQVSLRIQKGINTFNPQSINRSEINNESVTSTLSVNVPILSRGGVEYSDVRRAKYQTKKTVIQLDSQIKQVRANAKATWEAFAAAHTRVDATMQGVKSAEVAYEGTIQEELLGSKTIVDVLNAEEKLNRAREARIEAQKELVLASYRIKSLMGELTAERLNLPVEYFDPDTEFKKVKLKIVGF